VSSGFSVGGGDKLGAVKMAIVGGTVSAIGGGKFANGAWGSAFQYLFNEKMTEAEVEEMRASYRNPNKVAFGNRNTQWHKENGEIAMSILKAGTVVTMLPVTVEMTYYYMYTHPVETMTIAEGVIGYNSPEPAVNWQQAIGGFTNKIKGYFENKN
jgi:hypothetical protein